MPLSKDWSRGWPGALFSGLQSACARVVDTMATQVMSGQLRHGLTHFLHTDQVSEAMRLHFLGVLMIGIGLSISNPWIAIFGASIAVVSYMMVRRGMVTDKEPATCPTCEGFQHVRYHGYAQTFECPTCNGEGMIWVKHHE